MEVKKRGSTTFDEVDSIYEEEADKLSPFGIAKMENAIRPRKLVTWENHNLEEIRLMNHHFSSIDSLYPEGFFHNAAYNDTSGKFHYEQGISQIQTKALNVTSFHQEMSESLFTKSR